MDNNFYDKLSKFYDPMNIYNHHIMDKIKIVVTNIENLVELMALFDWDYLQNKLISNGFNINIEKEQKHEYFDFNHKLEIKNYFAKLTLSQKVKFYQIIKLF